MLNAGQESSSLVDIDSGLTDVRAVTFSADGEYILGGGQKGVRLWRVADRKEVESELTKDSAVGYVRCLAVSKDGRWIAAGTFNALIVWDAKTYEEVFKNVEMYANGVDFSPDSARLVTGSLNFTASVWDVAARQRVVGPLKHDDVVIATKYSPQGTHFAIATPNSVHLYNADGTPLVRIPGKVLPWFNSGLLWELNNRLFVVSDGIIRQIDATTGSQVADWPVPDSTDSSCIALPQHGQYVAYATRHSVTVWDTSTHAQLAVIQHPQTIRSIACSPDDRFLVVAGEHGKITAHSITHITESIPLPRLHSTFLEPDIQIADAALDAWKYDQLGNAEALLTAAVSASQGPNHHMLAGRALVKSRLKDWDAALRDAEQSIEIQPSVAGYIAKSVALAGKGEKYDAYRACDVGFERFHSTHVSFILLMKAVIVFMAGDQVDAISRVNDLIAMVYFNSICYVVQAYMHFLRGNSHLDRRDYVRAIQDFERARAQMRYHASRPLFMISLISGWKFDDLGIRIRKQLCETLYAAGRIKEAGESLLEMLSIVEKDDNVRPSITMWLSDSMSRCLSAPESGRDAASTGHDVALPSFPTSLLKEWTKLKLASGSWKNALSATGSFTALKFTIYRAICERLETLDQIADATECFHQMMRELGMEETSLAGQAEWISDFKQRFSTKLERRGDVAVDAGRYDEAISEYSAALSLEPVSPQELFIKRSKTYLAKGLWEDALKDANEVIRLDPSSPWGYERKHAALHKLGDCDYAIVAFETMLSKMASSPDPEIRRRCDDYVSPSRTRAAIRKAVRDAIHDLPRVLINTTSGRLCNKTQQASSFESLPVFKEMISSMTTDIDYTRIEQEVTQYYRYATFSHRWEDDEPLFEKVVHIVVYDLEESLTHDKLRMFCKIVRDAGFNWAWSDTCCINKGDLVVLQEALVTMFKWYEGSSVTIVYLRDVRSPGRRGNLVKSIWNTRAWTFQEYHASKVVRFYTEDWKPYLNLDIPNHKESPEIVSEMEEATGISAEKLMGLRPGLDDIREKLCLASRRETTLVEDAAYSLFGVFAMSLPVVYGDGDRALGKFLAQVLTSSGDTSILAWTGKSGTYNSCLPANTAVFSELQTTHVPQAMTDAEMDNSISRSLLNFDQAERLYRQLSDLAVPMFAGRRLKLPCITFKLGPLSLSRNTSERVYRAQTTALGVVEIKTKEDLSRFESLYLAHPWIDSLLHQHAVGGIVETTPEGSIDDRSDTSPSPDLSNTPPPPPPPRRTRGSQLVARFNLSLLARTGSSMSSSTPAQDTRSLLPPSSMTQEDMRTRVLQFLVRLRQPFGALLLTPVRQNASTHKRVATDSMIRVKVLEDASLEVLRKNVRTLDVL